MRIRSRIALVITVTGLAFGGFSAATVSAAPHQPTNSVVDSYSCSVSTPEGTFPYSASATFTGSTPAAVPVGATVLIGGFQARVSVPGSVLDEAYGYGVRTIAASVTAFDVTATDATVATVNIAKRAVKVGHARLAPSGNPSLAVNIPRIAAKVGSWVASTKGTMVFSPGDATLHFKTNLGSLNVQCSPSPPNSALSTTTVV
jgi:hypothetical protein